MIVSARSANARPACLARHGPGKHAHPDQKFLLLAEDPRPVEPVLIGYRFAQRQREPLLDGLTVRERSEEGRLDQGVEDMGARNDGLGKFRRRSHDRGDQRQQARIRAEQREELGTRRQAGEEAVEGGKGRIGVVRLRQCLEKRRRDLRQSLAGGCRAHRRIAAEMPSADRARDFRRVGVAEPRKCRQRLRIVGVAREDEAAEGRGERRRFLEEVGIVVANLAEGSEQRLLEGRDRPIAGHARDDRQLFPILGQRVGLRVVDHLQAMLDRAERLVRGLEIVAGSAIDPAAVGQRRQHVERAAAA